MFTPTLDLLQRIYPDLKCILVGNELSASLFSSLDSGFKIFVDTSKQNRGIIKRLRAISALAADINEYLENEKIELDCALTTQNNFFSALLLSKIHAKATLGYGDKNVFGLRKFLLTHNIKFNSGRPPACRHQVLSYVNLLLPLLPPSFYQSIDLDKLAYKANPKAGLLQNKLFSQIGDLKLPAPKPKQSQTYKNPNETIIGIGPGASYGISKMWLPEYFSEVAITLIKKGHKVKIYGSKSEMDYNGAIESNILQAIGAEQRGLLENLTGKTDFAAFVASLKHCALYIGNDSGIMHVARALRIPLIVFYGPSPFEWCSPWSPDFYQHHIASEDSDLKNEEIKKTQVRIDSSVVLKRELSCAPCYKRTCPLSHHNCMRLITPDEVLVVAESLLFQR